MDTVRHVFDPVFDEHSARLVLGTMPSPASRRYGFYYSHPQNRFWRVLSALYDEPLPVSPEQKRGMVLRHGIALWDVLASCEIQGAADHTIRNPEPNDLSVILEHAPIKTIFTTGKKAEALYRKFCLPVTGIEAISLPSSSPANQGRYPLPALIDAYKCLR
jgi:hypoxanthine-DNA glycosylase